MIYDSILDTIGNTPVVKLHRLPPKHVDLYVKVEAFNPAGSVKDRLAQGKIELRTQLFLRGIALVVPGQPGQHKPATRIVKGSRICRIQFTAPP